MRFWLVSLVVAGVLLNGTNASECTEGILLSGPEITALLRNGTRVVRGKDWSWESQDGGPGHEGRVTNADRSDGWVNVEWDAGESNSYRMGSDDSYDLQLACSEVMNLKSGSNASCSSLSGPQLVSVLKNGTRVVRGQDWKWNNQDGGAGHEGRITNTNDGDGWVKVEWDSGDINSYRMGHGDKYDLQLPCYDSQNKTRQNPTSEKSVIPLQQELVVTSQEDTETTTSEKPNPSTSTIPSIEYSGSQLADLMKNGTRVVRGKDWDWGNQDGGPGKKGTIIREVVLGWVQVQWDLGNINAYRMGSDDKYDLALAQINVEEPETTTISNFGPNLVTRMKIGTHVVRGKDWTWDDQDGGEGHTGTIMSEVSDGWVDVQWESGDVNSYRMGDNDKYDLNLAPANSSINVTTCHSLSGSEIVSLLRNGTRVVRGKDWKWESQDGIPGSEGRITDTNDGVGWVKVKWDTGESNSYRMGYKDNYDLQLACSETLPSHIRETCATKNFLSGSELAAILKNGTRVVRGQDWKWDNQDGGPGHEGRITETTGVTGWVVVEWDTGDIDSYRMGYDDKYDLQLACSEIKNQTSLRNSTCAPYNISGPQLASFMKIGTRVIRGRDWTWDSQDGGPGHEGSVTDTDNGDGWVDVKWDTGESNSYRMGSDHKYDLLLACSETLNESSSTVSVTESRPDETEDTVPTLRSIVTVDRTIQQGPIYGSTVSVTESRPDETEDTIPTLRSIVTVDGTIQQGPIYGSEDTTTESGPYATEAVQSTTISTIIVDKNIEEGNELFGKLVGKEISSVPRRNRIKTMQDVLEILKKMIKY